MSALLPTLLFAAMMPMQVAPAATPQTVDLTWRPKAGTTQVYRLGTVMQMDFQGQQTEITFGARVTSKVTKIENGEVFIESLTDEMKLNFGGQEMDPAAMGPAGEAPRPVIQVRKLDGSFVRQEGEGGMPSNPRVDRFNNLRPPTSAELGKEYFVDMPGDKAKNLVPARAKFTVTKLENVAGARAWRIEVVFAEMEGNAPLSAMGTMWLEEGTGELVKMSMDLSNVQWVEMMPPSNARFTMERVPAR